ncbi:hypothetical protein RFI_06671 [Reticulomyxa filosa]|uniref:Uncharacterized protein n=1 Tax=Reticulomyxa filosa TaxID=46433 RepID=X6NVX8_RETFI|nr:hypothetical protein RFI_06671 [Reticulomyxa filosa]|eukprot:ETO30450.1 hypothetical protein RFI_06671 [Reticulomyxa filosa]
MSFFESMIPKVPCWESVDFDDNGKESGHRQKTREVKPAPQYPDQQHEQEQQSKQSDREEQPEIKENNMKCKKEASSKHFTEIFLILRQSPSDRNTLAVATQQAEKWYYFEEAVVSWIPMSFELQEKFDTEYCQAKYNLEKRLANPHFVFQINERWYGVRFDFSEGRDYPYGEQFKLGCDHLIRTIIKTRPDKHNLINNLPVGY